MNSSVFCCWFFSFNVHVYFLNVRNVLTLGCLGFWITPVEASFTWTGIASSFSKAVNLGTTGSITYNKFVHKLTTYMFALNFHWVFVVFCNLHTQVLCICKQTFLLTAQILSHSIITTDLEDPCNKTRVLSHVVLIKNSNSMNSWSITNFFYFCSYQKFNILQ